MNEEKEQVENTVKNLKVQEMDVKLCQECQEGEPKTRGSPSVSTPDQLYVFSS